MEGPNKKTPEKIAEIEKSRTISDAELKECAQEFLHDKHFSLTADERHVIEKYLSVPLNPLSRP